MRLGVLRVFVLFCVLVFVQAILSRCPKTWHVNIVYNILSLNISSIYVTRLYKTITSIVQLSMQESYYIWINQISSFHLTESVTYLFISSSAFNVMNRNRFHLVLNIFSLKKVSVLGRWRNKINTRIQRNTHRDIASYYIRVAYMSQSYQIFNIKNTLFNLSHLNDVLLITG